MKNEIIEDMIRKRFEQYFEECDVKITVNTMRYEGKLVVSLYIDFRCPDCDGWTLLDEPFWDWPVADLRDALEHGMIVCCGCYDEELEPHCVAVV
jgi:hypothetical protein